MGLKLYTQDPEPQDAEEVDSSEEQTKQHSQPSSEDVFPTLPALPVPQKVTPLSKKNEFIRHDAEIYHSLFTGLAYSWSQATSVDEVVKLSLATSRLIRERRQALLLPYAAAPTEESDDRYVLPLD